jgi:hypothetical protein
MRKRNRGTSLVYQADHYPEGAFDTSKATPIKPLGRRAFVAQSHIEHMKIRAESAKRQGRALLVFEIECNLNGKGGGQIYCPTMKYESGVRNITKEVAILTAEFLDYLESEYYRKPKPKPTKRKHGFDDALMPFPERFDEPERKT